MDLGVVPARTPNRYDCLDNIADYYGYISGCIQSILE